jgi:hypothetical protein
MIMKRLIVISVVFALVAGTAFAEINVGGAVFGRFDVIEGTSEKDDNTDWAADNGKGKAIFDSRDITTGGTMTRLRLDGSGESEDGTFGGYIRFEAGSDGGSTTGWGHAWWKPIDQFKLLIGSAGYDGFWAKDGVARWGFYRDAGDVFANIEGWAYGAAFYDGITKGALLTITPLEALEVNIGIPFFGGGRGEDIYKSTHAQVAYNIDGIGDLAITYRGDFEGQGNDKAKHVSVSGVTLDGSTTATLLPAVDIYSSIGANTEPKFFAYFNLTAVENLGVQLGIGFTLPAKDEPDAVEVPNISKTTETFNYMPPVAIGLGASYDMGAIGVKLRVQAQLAEKYTYDVKTDNLVVPANSFSGSYEIAGPFKLSADILPSFAINDSMKVFLSAGLAMTAARDYDIWDTVDSKVVKVTKTEDAVVGWHIMPYFTKSVGWCQGFYAGFRLWSDGSKYTADYNRDKDGVLDKSDPVEKAIVNWSVPIGIAFQF